MKELIRTKKYILLSDIVKEGSGIADVIGFYLYDNHYISVGYDYPLRREDLIDPENEKIVEFLDQLELDEVFIKYD